MMYTVSQVLIFICSAGAIYLLSRNDKFSKYGPPIGLFGAPFWFYVAINDNAWGVFFLQFIFVYLYSMGLYNFWFRKEKKTEHKK